MSKILFISYGIVLIALSILMCLQESRNRKINFFVAILLCLLITPFFAYFVMGLLPAHNPRGCIWCGNLFNEVEYCGICGKNDNGEFKNKL
jgi:uncharacterized membrane protein